LFRATTVLGFLPSESSPRRNRAPLSRPLLLPCSHPPACWCDALRALSSLVSSTPTLTRSCLIPPNDYGSPFGAPEGVLSRSPWVRRTELTPFRKLHLLRSLHPPTSPFAPTRVATGWRSILSWVSRLSRAFSFHASDSLTRQDHECPGTLPRSKAQERGSSDLAAKPSPGEHANMEVLGSARRQTPVLVQEWTAPPLDGVPTPLALGIQASPSP
jgi:hypothetical protein